MILTRRLALISGFFHKVTVKKYRFERTKRRLFKLAKYFIFAWLNEALVILMQVNILEAKNQLSQLIKAAQAGEEVIIANRGKPLAKLISLHQENAAAPQGSDRAILGWLDTYALPEKVCQNEAAIEAAVQEKRQAWD